ncbi:MAG: hypothetical protein M1837_000116 [Sclerophora amabilis]|nr:MAG: hypothetical protein M1837_000116 [Sclerophora amabilis]
MCREDGYRQALRNEAYYSNPCLDARSSKNAIVGSILTPGGLSQEMMLGSDNLSDGTAVTQFNKEGWSASTPSTKGKVAKPRTGEARVGNGEHQRDRQSRREKTSSTKTEMAH